MEITYFESTNVVCMKQYAVQWWSCLNIFWWNLHWNCSRNRFYIHPKHKEIRNVQFINDVMAIETFFLPLSKWKKFTKSNCTGRLRLTYFSNLVLLFKHLKENYFFGEINFFMFFFSSVWQLVIATYNDFIAYERQWKIKSKSYTCTRRLCHRRYHV